MNVILTSSEHVFPYSLRDLGYNLLDITGFIYAGEVPPDKAFELLTKKWCVGHNLAVALIDHYGGNLYDISEQLIQLKRKGENLDARSQVQANAVLKCLKFDGDKRHMRELLTQLAENGFAPICDVQDPEAEVISKFNVGGVVQRQNATVIGLPVAVWGKHRLGLVPSKQSIRLVIAEVLEANRRP